MTLQRNSSKTMKRPACFSRSSWPDDIYFQEIWLPQIVSLVFAFITIISIGLACAMWQNKPLVSWSFDISLNTIISTLVTVLYFLLLHVVSSCIGQLKWNCFARATGRPLGDLVLYDEASRGILGCLTILLKSPKSYLANMGALTTIAVTAVGPYTQQFIGAREIPHGVSTAVLPVADSLSTFTVKVDYQVLPRIHLAAVAGIAASRQQQFAPNFTCPNGDCSWPEFFTLTFTSQCSDISHLLVSQLQEFSATTNLEYVALPNGLFFYDEMPVGSPRGANYSGRSDLLILGSESGIVAGLTAIEWWDPGADPTATECILRLGGQWRKASVVGGEYKEEALSEVFYPDTPCSSPWSCLRLTGDDQLDSDDTLSYHIGGFNCSVSRHDALGFCDTESMRLVDGSERNVTVHTRVAYRIAESMEGFFTSSFVTYSSPDTKMVVQKASGESGTGFLAAQGLGMPLNAVMENIARSFEQTFRNLAWQFMDPASNNFGVVIGTSFTNTTIYDIQWTMMVFPTLVYFLTASLLITTVIDTKRKSMHIWTNSSIAMLVHRLDDDVRESFSPLKGVAEIEKALKGTTVAMSKERKMLETVQG